MQGLRILANLGKPKMTVGTIVILQVFDSRIPRIQVDATLVVDSLARIFDTHTKIRDVVVRFIFAIFNSIWSFDGASDWNISWTHICLKAAYVWCFTSHSLKLGINITSSKVLFPTLYYLMLMVFKLDSWKDKPLIKLILFKNSTNILIVALDLSDYYFTF